MLNMIKRLQLYKMDDMLSGLRSNMQWIFKLKVLHKNKTFQSLFRREVLQKYLEIEN